MNKNFTYLLSFLFFCLTLQPVSVLAENGQMMFVAEMNTSNEVPPVRGDALGLMTFLVSEDRSEVYVHGAFTNLTGNIIGCHIHLGTSDTTGPVLIDLGAMITGSRIKGVFKTPPGFLAASFFGELYVNVHTTGFPSGEIRGQLNWKSEIILSTVISGASQIPPVPGQAFGLGAIRLSPNLTRMEYKIMYSGLSGPVTAAHIHAGDAFSTGPVITELQDGIVLSGTIEDPNVVQQVLFAAFFTGAYVNIHTAAHPDGEIRGQLQLDALNNGYGVMNGSQENPPNNSTAKGFGYAALNYPDMDTLFYLVGFDGLVPTAAHIHNGAAGKNGPVFTALTPSNFPGIYFGQAAISGDMLTAFFKDELYFNIHTAANPGGEIRGQIENNLLKSFAFDLCGDQEIPVKNVPAYGAAYVAVNKANTELDYGMIVQNLNGDATAAHIHDANFGANGTVLVPLDLPNPFTTNVIPITGTVAGKIDKDGAYFNVHTAANPAGEVRGQIRRTLSCKINTSIIESVIQELNLNNNFITQELFLEATLDKSMSIDLFINDAQGKLIRKWKQSFYPGFNKISIPIEQLASGFYLLNVVEGNNPLRSLKFIKN